MVGHDKGWGSAMGWESLWNIFVAFLFIASLLLLFHIVADLLRDKGLGKAVSIPGSLVLIR